MSNPRDTRRTPTPPEVAALRKWIATHFNRRRPRGMTPADGVLYQPIPFPDFEDFPCERDSSEARLRMLLRAIDYRDARVLDLGCANGFFLFRLLQIPDGIRGGLGIDHFEDNVRLAQELARIHGLGDRLEFRRLPIARATVEELLAAGPWHVCHLLSVHHHLARQLPREELFALLRRLYEACGTLVLEQGSLDQEEYEAWTGRREPFDTGAFSRLISMLESAGIPAGTCRPVGFGKYRSGVREDAGGSRRAIVACSRREVGCGVADIRRKRHRNGVFMELLRVGASDGDGVLWKNVVCGPGLAQRESVALGRLEGEPGFPRLVEPDRAEEEARDGLLRLASLDLRQVGSGDLDRDGENLRRQLIERLTSLADHGLIHGEIVAEHLPIDDRGRLLLIDFETARFGDEPGEVWRRDVFEPNPALGLGAYERSLWLGPRWREVDLVAVDAVLGAWGLPALTAAERRDYASRLERAVRLN